MIKDRLRVKKVVKSKTGRAYLVTVIYQQNIQDGFQYIKIIINKDDQILFTYFVTIETFEIKYNSSFVSMIKEKIEHYEENIVLSEVELMKWSGVCNE